MKKRVLFYLVGAIAAFSLQSCVTNYVVSKPQAYVNEYKSNAKVASLDNKNLESAKIQLLNSFKDDKTAAAQSLEASLKNEEIAKTVRFTSKLDDILKEAETYLGTPYRFGGMTRNGIDCSAFVLSVFGA
jgi:lipoprotein Spr